MRYYYQQGIELLFSLQPKKEDLVDALSDLSAEYGYIFAPLATTYDKAQSQNLLGLF
ncbi:hypothetical protein QUB29_19455 [Microcoleus sp. B4b_D2]|uniref:hypothetical protein n=1 Tax=Microcoleus sp. B4b_D2 TaxID=3055310 RepID=UPI002FD029F4